MNRPRNTVLPASLPPRGLNRIEAARYIGVSATLFDELIRDRRMPKPIHVNARRIWDRQMLDEAFTALQNVEEETDEPWNKVSV